MLQRAVQLPLEGLNRRLMSVINKAKKEDTPQIVPLRINGGVEPRGAASAAARALRRGLVIAVPTGWWTY